MFNLRTTCQLGILFLSIAAGILFSACDDNNCDGFVDSACLPSPPLFADLEIEITINNENRRVPIEIFEGDFDDPLREWYLRDTITTNRAIYALPVDQFAVTPADSRRRWNVAVTYAHEGKTIIALDGARIGWREDDDCAGFVCYTPINRNLNMRLKIRD